MSTHLAAVLDPFGHQHNVSPKNSRKYILYFFITLTSIPNIMSFLFIAATAGSFPWPFATLCFRSVGTLRLWILSEHLADSSLGRPLSPAALTATGFA
jgi:hypothetical protein